MLRKKANFIWKLLSWFLSYEECESPGGICKADGILYILRMRISLNGKTSLPRDILSRAFAGKVAFEHFRNFFA